MPKANRYHKSNLHLSLLNPVLLTAASTLTGAEDILWILEQPVMEVEERELSLYLQLLDLASVQATMSEFGTTVCVVKSRLEEVE
jgi:hypothetical protein